MIDSHAHLNDPRFKDDREYLITHLRKNGIDYVVNIGADLPTSEESVALAKKYAPIYAAVGVHPHDAKTYTPQVEERLIALSKEEKVVAIGEIGLDYYYDNSPRDVQVEVFQKQMDLAQKVDLPIVIHSRDAAKETFDLIKAHLEKDPRRKFLIHCYSGSVEMMREYVKMGCFIALGGVVTFKNSKVAKEVAAEVPLDKLLLETDAPYLTPHPHRGKRNEPLYLRYIAEEIAGLRGISPEELVKATDGNTNEFYGITP